MKPQFFINAILLFLFSCACLTCNTIPHKKTMSTLSDTVSIENASKLVSLDLMKILGDTDFTSLNLFYRQLDSTAQRLSLSYDNTSPACQKEKAEYSFPVDPTQTQIKCSNQDLYRQSSPPVPRFTRNPYTKNTKSKSASASTQAPPILDSLVKIVYSDWNITFDPAQTTIQAFLPHYVYKNKRGSCVGISLIILMLAEKLHAPISGVMLPGHFFCRYDDGAIRMNIEPNKNGIARTDEYYKQHYYKKDEPWYNCKSLSKNESISLLCYNAGTTCLGAEKYNEAIVFFKQAILKNPDFIEARGNCGLAFANCGKMDSAIVYFRDLFEQHSSLRQVAENYGNILLLAHDYSKASRIFEMGLKNFPDDSILVEGLMESYSNLGMIKVADSMRTYMEQLN